MQQVYRIGHLMQGTGLTQLTGCRETTLRRVAQSIDVAFHRSGRGRPLAHGAFLGLCLTLMKWRNNLSLRTLQVLTGICPATISRYVRRVAEALAHRPLARTTGRSIVIVDSTSTRVASTEANAYSGYKHHRCGKVQVVTRKDGMIVDVSQSYPGSMHDKRIWNMEAARLLPKLSGCVLGDKAYAGGVREGSLLHRPIKRGETAWKLATDASKRWNASLSRIRVKIEHCFARLKNWKVLSGLLPYHWMRLGDIVRALAVVHNMELAEATLHL